MRLWSLHPSYLDRQGLLACWREGLLARKVLLGQTRGYRHHPQLDRFKTQGDPVGALDDYLLEIHTEAERRGYAFDRTKLGVGGSTNKLTVTNGQLAYELEHLKSKLLRRDFERYQEIVDLVIPMLNLVFEVVEGDPEAWERVRLG